MDADLHAALRAQFPADQISQIPKGGQQLDYVGHADVTDRLLNVDPDWTWEPMGCTPEGLPALDQYGNLWINLTIGGVTRPGVGDGKSMKECVGDALRNAAMRFGVALDLWAKGDRNFGLAGHDAPAKDQTGPTLKEQVVTAARSRFTSEAAFHADFLTETGKEFRAAPQTALSEYLAHLEPFTATDTLVPEAEPPAATPPGQGDTDAAEDPVTDARDRALSLTKKGELARLLMEVGRDGIGGALTTDAAGKGLTLETLINKRLREAA